MSCSGGTGSPKLGGPAAAEEHDEEEPEEGEEEGEEEEMPAPAPPPPPPVKKSKVKKGRKPKIVETIRGAEAEAGILWEGPFSQKFRSGAEDFFIPDMGTGPRKKKKPKPPTNLRPMRAQPE